MRKVEAFYSLNGGGEYTEIQTLSKLSDLPTQPFINPPAPAETHTFIWDVFNSGFYGQSDNVVLRLKAYPSFEPITNSVPGPYQLGYVATQTYPFRVRGNQLRVLNEQVHGEDGSNAGGFKRIYLSAQRRGNPWRRPACRFTRQRVSQR